MKTNEALEKIYISPRQGGDYAPYWSTDSQDGFGIEYTRTDAFIKKIYDWLKDYAFVDEAKNVHLPTLLHDFLKDSRSF